ncbi:MAG: hypothetical protein IPM64_10910 [Phycisphaerales bacterium]|nr:hypothetical protein [Phycisphaerales bacterium]
MKHQPCITHLDDSKLIATIAAARARVLLLAPGVSDAVAQALATAWRKLGRDGVTVILDVDPEVCRLGYGTLEALKTLRAAAAVAGALVCQQPGVRIGLLISDESTWIFSPTPLLIEAGSAQPDRPNAIQLGRPPEQLSKDVGLGDEPSKERVVGLDPVKPETIDSVDRDLAQSPPVKFNLARRVRVFTSRFQFVELEMTGCFVSRRKVPIPSHLVGLAADIRSRFHAQFDLIAGRELMIVASSGDAEYSITELSLRKQRDRIIRTLLIPLKGYGNVVLRANKDRLVTAVDALKADVRKFQDGISSDLQKLIDSSVVSLVEALLPAVRVNPPESYKKYHGSSVSTEQLRRLLSDDITGAFDRAAAPIGDMSVSLIFKDLAYESLVDKEFLKIARNAMPGVGFLHEEHDAAKAEARS